MADREKVIESFEMSYRYSNVDEDNTLVPQQLVLDALALLKAQEPRVMTAEEVADCEEGTVLWVEERQGVTWNLFPLEIDVSSTHPDTGTNYLFFITYHDIRKFECDEYNRTWRCWTSRPTDEHREAIAWKS